MAAARIHRQSCELGRLPPVCMCCGAPATRLILNRFNCEPTWQIVFLPVILLIMLLVGIFTGLRLKYLYNPLAADPIEFPAPACESHCHRLSWHRYFLWGLVVVLLAAMAVLLPTSISIAAADRGQDVSAKIRFMETACVVAVIAAVVFMLLSMIVRLITPRVIHYSTTHIDMILVSPDFVTALQRTNSSLVPNYQGAPMGVPLTPAMQVPMPVAPKVIAILAASLLAMVSSCCLLGFGARTWTMWQQRRQVEQIRAESKQRQEQFIADAKKRSEEFARTGRPPASAPKAPAIPKGFPTFDRPSSQPADGPFGPSVPPSSPGTSTTSTNPSDEQQEQFTPRGSDRYPPNSREILDTTQLAVGTKVWARWTGTWHKSVVIRVENRMMARVHFLGWPSTSDAMVPAPWLRIAGDADGSAPSSPPLSQPAVPQLPISSAQSKSPAEEKRELPSRRRTWTDTTGQFKIEATFVRLSGGSVTLRKVDDNQEVQIPLAKLSPEDRRIAEQLAAAR